MGRLTINGIEKLRGKSLPQTNISERWWVSDVSDPIFADFNYAIDLTNGHIHTYLLIERGIVDGNVTIKLGSTKIINIKLENLRDGPDYLLKIISTELWVKN